MAIANTIPGFEGLTSSASNLIKSLMSGNLGGAQKRAIFDAGAERGTASGMPGSTGIAGSLFANNDLRNIGVSSQQNQQQGFQDLLAMITGYSGTVAPTTGQEQQQNQFNTKLAFDERNRVIANNEARRKEQEAQYPNRRSFTSWDGPIRAGGRGPSWGF